MAHLSVRTINQTSPGAPDGTDKRPFNAKSQSRQGAGNEQPLRCKSKKLVIFGNISGTAFPNDK